MCDLKPQEARTMSELIRKVKDRFRDLLQTHGSSKAKQRLWDKEFVNGRWDCLDTTTEDCVYSRLEKWVKGGSILDLGCGSGSTPNELDESAFSEYTGVDISEVAIVKARERTMKNGRGHKCRFLQGDVVSYEPGQKVDVILLRDSIYYIKRPQIKARPEAIFEMAGEGRSLHREDLERARKAWGICRYHWEELQCRRRVSGRRVGRCSSCLQVSCRIGKSVRRDEEGLDPRTRSDGSLRACLRPCAGVGSRA